VQCLDGSRYRTCRFFVNGWCGLAGPAVCFSTAMAAGVWQLWHSAESPFELLPDCLRKFQLMSLVLGGAYARVVSGGVRKCLD